MMQFLCDYQALIVTGLTLGLVAMFPFRHAGAIRFFRKASPKRSGTRVIQDPVEEFKTQKLARAPFSIHMGKTPASLSSSGSRLVTINPGNRWKEAIILPEGE